MTRVLRFRAVHIACFQNTKRSSVVLPGAGRAQGKMRVMRRTSGA